MGREYKPAEFESKWYKYWEEEGLFKAEDFLKSQNFIFL